MSCGRRRRRGEAGGATVFGISVIGFLTLFTAACVGVAGMVVAHRRAQSAADLGSLGAASAVQGGRAPCAVAADVAQRNGARVVLCLVQGETVTLRVEVSTVRIFGQVRHTQASARAGPVGPDLVLVPR